MIVQIKTQELVKAIVQHGYNQAENMTITGPSRREFHPISSHSRGVGEL